MPKPQQILTPQQPTHLEISFHKQNNHLAVQQNRLNVEILRVHTIEKLRMIQTIFDMSQTALCQFFTAYQLFPYHQNNMNINSLLESQNLKLIKNQDKIYFGQVQRKKRNGCGVNIGKDGKVYEGQFSNNQKFGHGVQIYPNGNLYIGQFQNGKKHGHGQFFWFNLSSKNPKQDEFVEYYDGQWWGGLPDGSGVHQKINGMFFCYAGDLYTGSFKNGLKHGQGSEYFGSQTYKGQYTNGLPQGYGEYKWKDGSYYKGDFKQGLRNGYGVWGINENSTQMYKGHYCMDKKSGYGVYEWQNGWVYKGNFQNDLRNGFGELHEGSKCVYRGYWKNGEQTDEEVSGNVLLDNSMSKTFTKTSSQIYNRKAGSAQKLGRYQNNGIGFNPQERMQRQRRNQSASKRKAQFLDNESNDIWPVSYKEDFLLRKRPQSLTSSARGSQVKRSSTTQRKTHQQQNRPLINNFQLSSNTGNRTSFTQRQLASRTIGVHGFNNKASSTIGSTISRPIMRTSNMGNLYVPVRKFETIKRGAQLKYC